jgi:hypothetical protein
MNIYYIYIYIYVYANQRSTHTSILLLGSTHKSSINNMQNEAGRRKNEVASGNVCTTSHVFQGGMPPNLQISRRLHFRANKKKKWEGKARDTHRASNVDIVMLWRRNSGGDRKEVSYIS